MKKIICKKEYDTDTATVIRKCTSGYFGEESGYEETLYQTPEGLYFVYTNGGAASPYPCEDISRLAKTKVESWLQAH